MAKTLNWGILSTGRISGVFAKSLADTETGKLMAVGSRTQAAADKFGDQFSVPRRYGSYEALLADRDIQAVYISPPHPMHAEWAIKAAEAGKHILCEKPLAMNEPEATRIVEAARRHDVFLMEAFMYRCTPQTAKLVELVRNKAIGEVRIIQATFSFQGGSGLKGRLLNPALGGGGIMDVGCYTASMARLIAGTATGRDFAEPEEVAAVGHLGAQSCVDEYAIASLKFPSGILAQLTCGVQVNHENVVRIFGTEGHILVPSPWGLGAKAGTTTIIVEKRGAPETITIASDRGSYALEADVVAANLERRQVVAPAMSWNDTLGNIRTLDRWRKAIGLVYDFEKPA